MQEFLKPFTVTTQPVWERGDWNLKLTTKFIGFPPVVSICARRWGGAAAAKGTFQKLDNHSQHNQDTNCELNKQEKTL